MKLEHYITIVLTVRQHPVTKGLNYRTPPRKLCLKAHKVLNLQRNLIFSNVPAVLQPSATPRMKVLRETLLTAFKTLSIFNPFAHINRHQCVGVFTVTRLHSIVMELTTNEVQDSVINKLELLRLFVLHYCGIVSETPSLHKHQIVYSSQPNTQCYVIWESQPVAVTSMTSVYNSMKDAPAVPSIS